jgi:arylsulfatase A-like enzyme
MMKHLALDEVGWFGHTLAGEPYPAPFDAVDWDADPDWEWRTGREDSPEELRALYDDCVGRADAAIDRALARNGLDTESVEESSDHGAFSLRWILLHMIEEYARHNGQADLIRESIDGKTGE